MTYQVKHEKIISKLLLLLAFTTPLTIDTHLKGDSLGISVISEPLCLLISVVCFFSYLSTIRSIRFNYLDSIIILHVLALLVNSIFSWNSIMSIKYSIIVSTYIFAIYYGFKLIDDKEKFIQHLSVAFLLGHFILSTYSLINFLRLGIFYETSYLVAQPFVVQGHSNLSILLEAPAILTAVLLLQSEINKKTKTALIVALFSFIAVISFSCSRTSYITLSLSFIALFFFSLKRDTKKKLLLYVGVPVSLMLGIWKANDLIHYYQYKDDPNSYYNSESLNYDSNDIRTYKQTNMWEELWDISSTENRAGKSSAERVYRWVKGWELWQLNPITGIGLGTFADRYLEVYKNPRDDFEKSLADKKMNIHNLYLAWLFEGGIFVFLTGMGLVFFIAQTCIKLIKDDAPLIPKTLAFCFIPFLIHSLVQDYWNEPRVAIFFWFGIAVLNHFSHSTKTNKPSA